MNNKDIENILYKTEMTLSTINKRATAFFIDDMLLSFLLIISLWDQIVNTTNLGDIVSITNRYIFEYMLMKIFYHAFFVAKYGATLGKIAMKIKVVEIATMQKPTVGISINRAIFRVISESFFYLGFLWSFFNPTRQTLHDKTARTLVVDV
jgi:uncharacterized RDD family membrane protein YckC